MSSLACTTPLSLQITAHTKQKKRWCLSPPLSLNPFFFSPFFFLARKKMRATQRIFFPSRPSTYKGSTTDATLRSDPIRFQRESCVCDVGTRAAGLGRYVERHPGWGGGVFRAFFCDAEGRSSQKSSKMVQKSARVDTIKISFQPPTISFSGLVGEMQRSNLWHTAGLPPTRSVALSPETLVPKGEGPKIRPTPTHSLPHVQLPFPPRL